jgi:hypothetical protein
VIQIAVDATTVVITVVAAIKITARQPKGMATTDVLPA